MTRLNVPWWGHLWLALLGGLLITFLSCAWLAEAVR